MIDAANSQSMPDLAYAAVRQGAEQPPKSDSTPYMPQGGEKKAKKGFLSFLRKDNSSKFKVVKSGSLLFIQNFIYQLKKKS